MGVLSKGGLVSPKYSVPPRGETMHQTPKRFRGQERLEVFYHHDKFGGARIPSAAGVAKTLIFCLSDCLFVTLLNVRDCAPDFAMKSLEYRNDFDTVG